MACKCNLDYGKLDNTCPDNNVPWIQRTWRAVSGALPKQGCFSPEKTAEPDLSLEKSSFKEKFHPQGKLEVLPPLERHILLFMLQQSQFRGHVFPDADNKALQCKCCNSSAPEGAECSDGLALSLGIFSQVYPKDSANLAHTLMDGGGWTKMRLQTLAFARLRGEPGMMCSNSFHPNLDLGAHEALQCKEPQQFPLAILHRMSLAACKELIPQVASQRQQTFPDKETLNSMQDFFLYTEFEGRRVFEELDRDADGKVTVDDLRAAMHKMNLPVHYANNFMQSKHRLWPEKPFGWSEFSSLIQEKEPIMIRLFNSLGVSKSGTLQKTHVKDLLRKSGLPPTEDNVTSMMKCLAADKDGSIKYGQFRRFMLLIPTDQLTLSPWSVWLKAATSGGVQPSTQNLQVSVFKYIASLSKRLTYQFEAAKVWN